jgi:hypothetical protein
MATPRNAGLLSLVLVASALTGGCSSTAAVVAANDAEPGDSASQGDAELPTDSGSPSDSGTTPDAAPLADGGSGVWLADSRGFEVTRSGGFVAPPPPDASSCSGATETWKYDATSRTITRTGCSGARPLDAAVVLTPASAAELVAQVSSLTPTGPTSSCGADAPDEALTVIGPAGRRSYASDFYSGCGFVDAGDGQFLSFEALGTFIGYVDGFFTACTSADGGPPDTTRATCVP